MKYDKDQIYGLLTEKLSGSISREDNLLVEKALLEDDEIGSIWIELQNKHAVKGQALLNSINEDEAWSRLNQRISFTEHQSTKRNNLKRWISVAASIIILSSVAVYFISKPVPPPLASTEITNPKQADLTLYNGKTVLLSANKVVDLKEAHLNIENGKIQYTAKSADVNAWNNLSVPRMKDYKIILSDGSSVWLNSESTLRFPLMFSKDVREVYITGEAYFEVAKDSKKPFIVHAGPTAIRVLGTKFNVNGYVNNVVTSLVEGSVKSNDNQGHSLLLEPGFQSTYSKGSGFIKAPFSEDKVLSWMQGMYYFNHQSMGDISGVLLRWYNVKVVVDNLKINQMTLSGAIEKNKPLSVFLNNLQITSGITAVLEDNELHLK